MREIVPSISRGLDEVVMRALAKDSARRYQTAAEFAGDLRKALVRPRGGFVSYPMTREEQERLREEKRREAARRKRRLRLATFVAAVAVAWPPSARWCGTLRRFTTWKPCPWPSARRRPRRWPRCMTGALR